MTFSETETKLASVTEAYQAAHSAAVLIDRSNLGMLKFSGETRMDLINRMSTQKVIDLKRGQGAATILTTDIGRIIDRLILYAASENVYCLTSENNADNIARYLLRFVFFMDDFQVEDLSENTSILAVYGRTAQALLAGILDDEVELPMHHWRQLDLDGATLYVHRTDPIAGDGYFLICDSADKSLIWNHLVDGGIIAADEDAFEYLRIESGQPRFGHELTLDYIPLEANLWSDVSFNKGCYTGQEIIARMESRGQLAKKLVRLRPEAIVEAGATLTVDGKKAGTVTSAATGPRGTLALGYVRTSHLESNSPLLAGSITVKISEPES